ncbi:MAG: type IV pilus assembly protein PilM [Acidimicrobiales bacterium]
MAGRAIGLDIGTFAVRAAEVSFNGGDYSVDRFGQVSLPIGAVRAGVVDDVDVVADAVKRLWREVRFKSKQVVVGVANQRLIVRQTEFPYMSMADLEAALPFQAQDLIPMPLEDVELDFRVVDEFVTPEGDTRLRVLIAAAQKAMVESHLAVVRRAGLRATVVDAAPFSLVRSLVKPSLDVLGEGAAAEAIVCVGSGVTSVVVHEDGLPRFVRVLSSGGESITEAIVSGMGVDHDAAEDLKRRSGQGGDPRLAQAQAIVNQRLAPLVEEIRGSVQFYSTGPEALPLRRLLLTGGASLTTGLAESLASSAAYPVEFAQLTGRIHPNRIGLDPDQLARATPLMAVPVGLALAAVPLEKGQRRINLLPRGAVIRRQQQSEALVAAALVAAVIAGLVALWASQGSQVAEQHKSKSQAQARAATLRGQIAALSNVSAQVSLVSSEEGLVRSALAGDVAWSQVLSQLAQVVPSDTWLTSFSGQRSTKAATTTGSATLGSLTLAVSGLDPAPSPPFANLANTPALATWLDRLATLPDITNLYVPALSRPPPPGGGQAGATRLVTFTSTADLTSAAASQRVDQYIKGAGQ